MGLLHIISRFFGCKTEQEEETERPLLPYPTLHQHYPPNGERSRNIIGILIYKALKGVLQKVVRFIILHLGRPRRKDPILPVQNPAPTILKSNDPSSKGKGQLKEEVVTVKTRVVEEGQLTNVERSTFSYLGKPTKDPIPILPVQNPVRKDDPSSKGKEKLNEEVMIVKNRVAVDEGRWKNVESSPLLYPTRPRKDPIPTLPVQNPVPNFFINNDPSPKGKEKLKVKNRVVVDELERRFKHYSSCHRILLVGEGDFSFSAALAIAFGSASNITATSLNSIDFLNANYWNAPLNIEKLRSRGGRVMHEIDATEMANHAFLAMLKFDRIIFNFPFAGFFPKLPPEYQLRRHRRLVSLFLKNAKEMLVSEDGEIHITHKTNGNGLEWKLESIASSHGLKLIEAVKFQHLQYPGYNPKYGFGGDGNFNCYPCNTYKFGL